MKYQELWNRENTQIMERYDLAMERIAQIPGEARVQEPFRSYFEAVCRFAGQIEELARRQLREELEDLSLAELQELQKSLYQDFGRNSRIYRWQSCRNSRSPFIRTFSRTIMRKAMPIPPGRQSSWGRNSGRCFRRSMPSSGRRSCLPTSAD